MRTTLKSVLYFCLLSFIFIRCEKEDPGKEMKIIFKTENGYTSSDTSLDGGSTFKIGVEAETEKSKDPLIKFNITESLNGGAVKSVYSENINTTKYGHDETFILDTIKGNVHKYTFTITNRDGFNKQASLSVSVK